MNTTMKTPTLPQELVDTIFDHSHSDRQLLATCALVCRSWVPPSRYHLFRSIEIRKENAPVFLGLLESEDITFLPYLQALAFTHKEGEVCNAVDPNAAPRIRLIANVLLQLLAHPMVFVRSITFAVDCTRNSLCQLSFTDQDSKLLTNLSLSYPNVTILEFRSVGFISSFCECISRFTRLEDLTLTNDEVALREPYNGYIKHPPPIHLQSVALELLTWPEPNGSSLLQVLGWLTSGGRGPKIQRLRLMYIESRELVSVGSYLRFLRDSLQVLELLLNPSCTRGA